MIEINVVGDRAGRWCQLVSGGYEGRPIFVRYEWVKQVERRLCERFPEARRVSDWWESVAEAQCRCRLPDDVAGAYTMAEQIGIAEGWRDVCGAHVLAFGLTRETAARS